MVRKPSHVRPIILICLILLAAALPANPTAAQEGEGRLVVAWIAAEGTSAGDLYAWRSDDPTPRTLPGGAGANRLFLSPDGSRIAFTRGEDGYSESLWVIGIDGGEAAAWAGPGDLNPTPDPQGGTRQFASLAWLDAQTLLFNTAMIYDYVGVRNDDLWRVDAATGEVVRLLPDGQGGNFAVSPDRNLIALVTQGRYGQEPGAIRLVDPQGQPMGVPFEFEAVSTASEYAFYPQLYWLPDSSALRVAIPHPDLIYSMADAPAPTALWEIQADGTAAQIGEADATFFGQPRWSPDGEWLTAMRQVGPVTDNTHEIVLARGDGSDPQVIRAGPMNELQAPDWTPGGYFFFTAGQPGEVWLGAPGVEPERFPSPDERAFALTWTDAATAVYINSPVGPLELRAVTLDDRSSATIARLEDAYPGFDAVTVGPP